VEQEQDANFISRLHGGKLEIIPWPVIGSKGFYKLFSTLKKLLDFQKSPHATAGEFLHTIKTLMAKLKVCPSPACYLPSYLTPCGRPMTGERCLVCIIFLFPCLYSFFWTETMTEHRTKTLSSLLPIALATGYTEVELGFEPLKVLLLGDSNHKLADMIFCI
jgi:hypothetical protein